MSLSLITLLLASSAPQSQVCAELFSVSETVEAEELLQRLPKPEPKSEYESQAEFKNRLRALQSETQSKPLLVKSKWDSDVYFDAEKSKLVLHGSAFGHNAIRFSKVLRARSKGMKDDYKSGAIGFKIATLSKEDSTYTAQNGYGATVNIRKTEEHVIGLFERAGDSRKSVFVGGKKYKPLAQIKMSGQQAQDIIENGSFALAFTPKAPFRSEGSWTLAPSQRFRRHVETKASVIHADVRCAYALDSAGTAIASFEVK